MNITAEYIEGLVKQEIEGLDYGDIARGIIYDEIKRAIPNMASLIAADEIKAVIAAEIANFLNGPIEINDGWGKKERWDSFELMFRQEFKKQMEQKYEVKKEIDKQVAARVKSLMDQKYQEVITKIVDSISSTRIIPPETPK